MFSRKQKHKQYNTKMQSKQRTEFFASASAQIEKKRHNAYDKPKGNMRLSGSGDIAYYDCNHGIKWEKRPMIHLCNQKLPKQYDSFCFCFHVCALSFLSANSDVQNTDMFLQTLRNLGVAAFRCWIKPQIIASAILKSFYQLHKIRILIRCDNAGDGTVRLFQ